jgi:hypothetical protein
MAAHPTARIALAALALLLASHAPARAESSHWITYQGGLSLPSGTLADAVTQGYGGGIGYEWMRDRAFGLGGDIVYRRWRITDELDHAYETVYGQGVVAKLTNVDLTLHATAMLPLRGALRPFAQAGGGLYCTRDGVRIGGLGDDSAGNRLGEFGGAGVQFDAGPSWGVRVLGAVHHYEDAASNSNVYTSASAMVMYRMRWGAGPRW